MFKVTTLIPFLFLGIASSAMAQTPDPKGSAAELMGVQERSVQDTSLPTPNTFKLPEVRDPNPNAKGPLGNLEIGGAGITPRANPSDVFPKPSYEYNTGMTVRYRLNQ